MSGLSESYLQLMDGIVQDAAYSQNSDVRMDTLRGGVEALLAEVRRLRGLVEEQGKITTGQYKLLQSKSGWEVRR